MKAKTAAMTKNQSGVRAIAKTFSVIILVLGVIYCEAMYLSVVQSAFPTGLLRVFAMVGAIVGGLSVLLLLLSKSYWFTEGTQLIFAYVFTGLEVLAMILNILVAFSINMHETSDSWMQVINQYISPITPVIAIVGWTIIWSLDASSKRRHAQTNIEDEEHESDMEYRKMVSSARSDLRTKFLVQVISDMEEDLRSEHIRGQGRIAASQLAADALSEVTGMPIAPRLTTEARSLPASVNALSDKKFDPDHAVSADEPVMAAASFAQTGEVDPINEALAEAGFAGMDIHDIIATVKAAQVKDETDNKEPVGAKKKRGRPVKQAESTQTNE